MKKRRMNKFPMKFLTCRGILAVEVAVIILQVHTSTRATPLLPSTYNMEVVEVPVDRSSAEIQAWPNLNAWWPCTTTSKEVEINFQQEGPSLWISRDLMLKKTLSFQPDSRGKWMPNYEDPCAITPVTTNADQPACRCGQEILCQKKIFKKLDKSQTWKGNLGKNEHLGGLKTQKGGPGKNQRHEQK